MQHFCECFDVPLGVAAQKLGNIMLRCKLNMHAALIFNSAGEGGRQLNTVEYC